MREGDLIGLFKNTFSKLIVEYSQNDVVLCEVPDLIDTQLLQLTFLTLKVLKT